MLSWVRPVIHLAQWWEMIMEGQQTCAFSFNSSTYFCGIREVKECHAAYFLLCVPPFMNLFQIFFFAPVDTLLTTEILSSRVV